MTGSDFRCYQLHGLHVHSEVALAGRREPERSGACRVAPDVLVRWGDPRSTSSRPEGEVLATSPRRDHGDGAFLTAVDHGGELLLRFHGTCDLCVSPSLDEISCHRHPGADPDLVGVLCAGLGIAFVLGLRGEPILHASAVSLPPEGDVVAVAGGHGIGKSTVTALLCAVGCGFVTDDLLRIDVSGPGVRTVGGCSELRLRGGAAHVLDYLAAVGARRARSTADDRLAVELDGRPPAMGVLRAIVVPWPARGQRHVELERLAAAEALVVLARNPRFEGWVLPSVAKMQFEAVARVVDSTPVLRAVIPWSPEPTTDGARELVEALARLG